MLAGTLKRYDRARRANSLPVAAVQSGGWLSQINLNF